MDVGLNGTIDGIETARRILQMYNLPIIFLSSYSDEQRMMRAKEISPYGFMVKPVDEHQLLGAIADCISVRCYRFAKSVVSGSSRSAF